MHDQEEDRRRILLEYTAKLNALNTQKKEERKAEREKQKATQMKHKDIA